ncbi:MAG: helix-turn-helix domain-containing protein [Rhodothermales bacterium]
MGKTAYTTAEVCERLGITRRTLYRHIKAGKLRAQQPGGYDYRITRSALVDYLGSEEAYRDVFERENGD